MMLSDMSLNLIISQDLNSTTGAIVDLEMIDL